MNKYLVFYLYKERSNPLNPHKSRHIVFNLESFPNKSFILDRIKEENSKYLDIQITGITNISGENFEYWES